MSNRLNVVAVEAKKPKITRNEEQKMRFEMLWENDPRRFDPERNCMEKERIDRTWELITSVIDPAGKRIADLGCGSGVLIKQLVKAGAQVDAVDIAKRPLEQLKSIDQVHTSESCLPKTLLDDDAYDLVLCTDVIAHLHSNHFRLLMSEMARLMKPEGYVICSTPLDIQSDGAFARFEALAETEFTIEQWIFSYHLFYLRLRDFFEAPNRFVRASQNPELRKEALAKRHGIGLLWFKVNSTPLPSLFWRFTALILTPVTSLLRWNRTMLKLFERFSRFACSESAITHAIFAGKRRPLVPTPDVLPQETKHKKQVWE